MCSFKSINSFNEIPTGKGWKDWDVANLHKGDSLNEKGQLLRSGDKESFKVVALKERQKGWGERIGKGFIGGILCLTLVPFFSDRLLHYFFGKKETVIFGAKPVDAERILRNRMSQGGQSPNESSIIDIAEKSGISAQTQD